MTLAVDERDHVGSVLADQAEELILFDEAPANLMQLPVLVDSVDVEDQHQPS